MIFRTPSFFGLVSSVLLLQMTGCAVITEKKDIRVPRAEKLYVSVFVDETNRGEIGLVLTNEIRRKVYARSPEKLAMFFDENSVIMDGTVRKVHDRSVGSKTYELEVYIHARLLSKDGTEVADLGEFSKKKSYTLERDADQTDLNRHRALMIVVRVLADEVIQRVDTAGRTENLTPQERT